MAIYPHIGDWTERFEDALRVARLVDRQNFGVTFNLCHTLAAGDEETIPALLEKAGSSLLAVTINGADAGVKGPAVEPPDPDPRPRFVQRGQRAARPEASGLSGPDRASGLWPVG